MPEVFKTVSYSSVNVNSDFAHLVIKCNINSTRVDVGLSEPLTQQWGSVCRFHLQELLIPCVCKIWISSTNLIFHKTLIKCCTSKTQTRLLCKTRGKLLRRDKSEARDLSGVRLRGESPRRAGSLCSGFHPQHFWRLKYNKWCWSNSTFIRLSMFWWTVPRWIQVLEL